jgi:hypothetical protein
VEIPEEVLASVEAVELPLASLPGVNGAGVGMRESEGELFDELAIRILVDDLSDVPAGLPDQIEGVEVSSSSGGTCRSAPDLNRYKELRDGIHIRHPRHRNGTLGAIVQEPWPSAVAGYWGAQLFPRRGRLGIRTSCGRLATGHATVPVPTSPPDDRIGNVDRTLFPDLDTLGVKRSFVDAACST